MYPFIQSFIHSFVHLLISLAILCFKVDGFLEQLLNYDKENIHESNLKAVQTYLDNKEFDSDLVKGKSLAAGGLCAWTINVIRFYHVYCDVEPKRLSLAQANAELAAAEDKLSKIKAKIKVLHSLFDIIVRSSVKFDQIWCVTPFSLRLVTSFVSF